MGAPEKHNAAFLGKGGVCVWGKTGGKWIVELNHRIAVHKKALCWAIMHLIKVHSVSAWILGELSEQLSADLNFEVWKRGQCVIGRWRKRREMVWNNRYWMVVAARKMGMWRGRHPDHRRLSVCGLKSHMLATWTVLLAPLIGLLGIKAVCSVESYKCGARDMFV